MIQLRSRLDVADNTGARMATMIGVIGKKSAFASVGDVITANVKEASAGGTVKKGEVVRAVIVRTRQPLKRPDGSALRFDTIGPTYSTWGCRSCGSSISQTLNETSLRWR